MSRPRSFALALALVVGPVLARAGDLAPPTPDGVGRAVDGVFSEPDLRDGLGTAHLEASGAADVLARGTGNLLAAVQRWFMQHLKDQPLLAWTLVVVMVLLLIPLIWHIVWSLSVAFRRAPGRAPEAAGDDDPASRRRRSAELRADAQALAREGRLREAARALLLAFLALLDERQALAVAGSWTNREVLARLRVTAPVRARLQRFVDAADAACYGLQGPTPGALAEGEALLLELERGVGLAAPAHAPRSPA